MEAVCKGNNNCVIFRKLSKLLDSNDYLDCEKALAWMQSVISKSLDDLKYKIETQYGSFSVRLYRSGPAQTLNVSGYAAGKLINMDIDLVACFEFDNSQWPSSGFRPNPMPSAKV